MFYALHFFLKVPMFHVEHMKSGLIALFFMTLTLISCTKADPEAYRGDPILQDYVTQQGLTNSQLETLNKQILTTKKDMQTSVPQSGQYSVHRKRLHEQEDRAAKLIQQLQFWKLKIESRAKEAQSEYLKAFKEKKEWPDKSKVESYFAEKRLRQAKMGWNQKDRIEQYKAKTPQKPQDAQKE